MHASWCTVQVAVETVEAGDRELYEEVTALLHIFSKMDDGGRQMCGLLPIPQRSSDLGPSTSLAEEGASGLGPFSSGSRSGSGSGSSRGGSRGRRSESWQTPGIAEEEGEGKLEREVGRLRLEGGGEGEGEGAGEGGQGGSRCLAAVCQLLSLDNTPLTLELALSLVTRLVNRGMPKMIQAVKEQPGMLAALKTVYEEGSGSQRSKKKVRGCLCSVPPSSWTLVQLKL